MSTDVGTCEWLVSEVTRSYLIERGQLEPLASDFVKQHPYADANALAEHLIEQRMLTRFQAERVLEGQVKSLVMGPYILLEPIGAGSMGAVFRAEGKADRLHYAVKVLPMRSLWNVRLARRQVRAFSELPPHPAVVPFVDVGTAAGTHYLVWPLVEGETLETRVQRDGPQAPAEAARIARQIADGLQLCQRHGVFHGLLKPSNVMIGPDGQVRMLDFGIGALLAENKDDSLMDTMSTSQASAGMLDCAAPESILDPTRRNAQGDQYSLGCVLYFALTGQVPFPEGNAVDKMMAHQTKDPPAIRELNPNVPAGLVGVVDRLMEKVPEDRYRGFPEVIAALDGADLSQLPPLPSTDHLTLTPPPSAADRSSVALPSSAMTRSSAAFKLPSPPLQPRPAGQAPAAPPHPAPPPAAPPAAEAPLPVVPPPPVIAPKGSTSASKHPFPARPPERSLVQRVLDALMFWRSERDPVTCTVIAPRLIRPNETVTIAVLVHPTDPNIPAAELARSMYPTHEPVAGSALARPVTRGRLVAVHLALVGLEVLDAVQKTVWRGQPTTIPYPVAVPQTIEVAELIGQLTVGEGGEIVKQLEFKLPVSR